MSSVLLYNAEDSPNEEKWSQCVRFFLTGTACKIFSCQDPRSFFFFFRLLSGQAQKVYTLKPKWHSNEQLGESLETMAAGRKSSSVLWDFNISLMHGTTPCCGFDTLWLRTNLLIALYRHQAQAWREYISFSPSNSAFVPTLLWSHVLNYSR